MARSRHQTRSRSRRRRRSPGPTGVVAGDQAPAGVGCADLSANDDVGTTCICFILLAPSCPAGFPLPKLSSLRCWRWNMGVPLPRRSMVEPPLTTTDRTTLDPSPGAPDSNAGFRPVPDHGSACPRSAGRRLARDESPFGGSPTNGIRSRGRSWMKIAAEETLRAGWRPHRRAPPRAGGATRSGRPRCLVPSRRGGDSRGQDLGLLSLKLLVGQNAVPPDQFNGRLRPGRPRCRREGCTPPRPAGLGCGAGRL
jgi:hypothetical protein